MELNRSELQFGNYKCPTGNPLWFVCEGYARCFHSDSKEEGNAWKFGIHNNQYWFQPYDTYPFSIWNVGESETTIEEILNYIQEDIDRENTIGSSPQLLDVSYKEWLDKVK